MAADSQSRKPAKGGTTAPVERSALKRIPWWAVVLTIVVLISTPFAVDPIRNASTFLPVSEAHLVRSAAYLFLSPFVEVFDALTLMSGRQHIAILISLAVIFAAYRTWSGMRRGTKVAREILAAATALGTLVLVYAIAIIMPRPMAALAIDTPLNEVEVVVDFHSHTAHSHDGALWFTAEANRRWHRAAGFDVAYITDHRTVNGAEEGLAGNPSVAGQGTTLLQGLEVVWDKAHVNLLGAGRSYKGITDPNLRDVDDTALALASLLPNREPIVIFTFPDLLQHLHVAHGPGTPGVRAIELVDGSPRGLGEVRRKRTMINEIADTLNLALVAGSDNHGWGYTAAGWTLVLVPGWRGMTPDSLAAAIDNVIRTRGFEGTLVVERREANTSISTGRLVATLPLVTWRMITMLSDDERVSWLIWIWGIVLIGVAWRRRRASAAA